MQRSPGPEDRLLTIDEYERLPEDDRYRFELVRGRVVRAPQPAEEHAWLEVKAHQFLDAGARRVWLVRPIDKTVTVHGSPAAVTILRIEDILDGADLLPGFRLPLSRLFAV